VPLLTILKITTVPINKTRC